MRVARCERDGRKRLAVADGSELVDLADALGPDAAATIADTTAFIQRGVEARALAEKAKVDQAADTMRQQHGALEEGLAKLNDDIARLEEKLADAKTRQKAIVARHQTARRRLEVREKIHNPKIDDALVRFEQFERRMEHVEGRVEAYDLGLKKDLNREISALETSEAVEQELKDLKARMTERRTADEAK